MLLLLFENEKVFGKLIEFDKPINYVDTGLRKPVQTTRKRFRKIRPGKETFVLEMIFCISKIY